MIPVAERALGTQALAGGLHMSSTAEASGAEGSLREQWVSHTFQATRQQTRLRGFPLTTMQRVLDEVIRDRSAPDPDTRPFAGRRRVRGGHTTHACSHLKRT